jgi:hypothetical protein
MRSTRLWVAAAGLVLPLVAAAGDGVVEINQARALAGDALTGDPPGFPLEIRAPGSYRLTSDLSVSGSLLNPPDSTIALTIVAPHVTLDMNGFGIHCRQVLVDGSVPCTTLEGGAAGINSVGEDVWISNGVVRDMSGPGIAVTGQFVLERLRLVNNGGDGVQANASGQLVGVQAIGNQRFGILAGGGAPGAPGPRLSILGSFTLANAQGGFGATTGVHSIGQSHFDAPAGGQFVVQNALTCYVLGGNLICPP